MSTTVERLNRPRNLRVVPGSNTEPALTEAEILDTLRALPRREPSIQKQRAMAEEAAARRVKEQADMARNRRVRFGLIVLACMALAVPLGMLLRRVLS